MTSSLIPAELRGLVIERASGHCEYCLIHQDVSIYSHEVDQIIALKHGVKLVLIITLFLVYLVTAIKVPI